MLKTKKQISFYRQALGEYHCFSPQFDSCLKAPFIYYQGKKNLSVD